MAASDLTSVAHIYKRRYSDREVAEVATREHPTFQMIAKEDGFNGSAFYYPGTFVFPGIQPKQFIAEKMRKARVFVLPSALENLPCVLIEAMSCGTPVVATCVGDIDHIVGERQGILVEPGDIPALADAIKKVLTHPTI